MQHEPRPQRDDTHNIQCDRRIEVLPLLDADGYLPPGIHPCSTDELVARFGSGSPERKVETQELVDFIAWGRSAGIYRIIDTMTETLTAAGYEQTKEKLANLETRLARLARRADLTSAHQSDARRSYQQMITQYRREIKLYEAAHPETARGS
jgi:hypothetical protein